MGYGITRWGLGLLLRLIAVCSVFVDMPCFMVSRLDVFLTGFSVFGRKPHDALILPFSC